MSNVGLFSHHQLHVLCAEDLKEVRLRHTIIESWIPFTFRSTQNRMREIDFFYCPECKLLFDSFRSIHTLPLEARHTCLNCGILLLACFCVSKEMETAIQKSARDRKKLHATEKEIRKEIPDRKELKDTRREITEIQETEKNPWFVSTCGKEELSFWCACGSFHTEYDPPVEFAGKHYCQCTQEWPGKELGWVCKSCKEIQSMKDSQEQISCSSCQTLHAVPSLEFLEFKSGILLDPSSREYWKKRSLSQKRLKSTFQKWIEVWNQRFPTCVSFREAQLAHIFIPPERWTDLKECITSGVILLMRGLLDIVFMHELERRYKHLRKEKYKKELAENDEEDWGDVFDPFAVQILAPLEPMTPSDTNRIPSDERIEKAERFAIQFLTALVEPDRWDTFQPWDPNDTELDLGVMLIMCLFCKKLFPRELVRLVGFYCAHKEHDFHLLF